MFVLNERIDLEELEERIDGMWAVVFAISICLWFPLFYDIFIEMLHIPQLLTGLAGDIFVLIYMLIMLIFWGVAMFKVTKLMIRKRNFGA